jgi:hypothetical protein
MFKKDLKEEAVVEKICEIASINPADIFVTLSDVGFGLKEANPMKKVGFFRKEQEGTLQSKRMEESEI